VTFEFAVVNTDSKQGCEQAARFKVTKVPAFIIRDKHVGTVIARADEFQTAEQINALVKKASADRLARVKHNEALLKTASVRITHTVGYSRACGSGTIIRVRNKRAWVLTAAHLFPGDGAITVEPVHQQAGKRYVGCIVVHDSIKDLAVIRFDADADLLALEDIGTATTGSGSVVVCGYPGDWSVFRRLDTKMLRLSLADGLPIVVTQGDVESGTSGGALTLHGTIVGVVSCVDRAAKETYCPNGDSIQAILSQVEFPKD